MKECEKPLHVNLQADEKVTDYTCAPPPSLLPGVVQAWDLRCLCIYNMWVRGPMLDSINSMMSEPTLTSRACDLVGGWSNAYLIIIIFRALTSFFANSASYFFFDARGACVQQNWRSLRSHWYSVLHECFYRSFTQEYDIRGYTGPEWSTMEFRLPLYVHSSLCLNIFKGIIHLKIKLSLPQAIKDQIFREMLHYITVSAWIYCSEWVPTEWVSKKWTKNIIIHNNGSSQTTDKIITCNWHYSTCI